MARDFAVFGRADMARLNAITIVLVAGLAVLPAITPDPSRAEETVGDVQPSLTAKAEPGLTVESAIPLVGYTTTLEGIQAERAYINRVYPGWEKAMQQLIEEDGRYYDLIHIESPAGETKGIYFDITDWFGAELTP